MPKTLLLADDSVTIQKVVGISFASEDIQIVTVDNGTAAVAKAKEIRPDIVLADVVMPGLNGYEVCRQIKSDARLKHVPVLLLTGTFEAFDEARAREAGSDGHITKPFEAQALVDLVNARLAASAPPAAEPPAPAPAATAAKSAVGTSPLFGEEEEPFDFMSDEVTAPSGTRPAAAAAPGALSFDGEDALELRGGDEPDAAPLEVEALTQVALSDADSGIAPLDDDENAETLPPVDGSDGDDAPAVTSILLVDEAEPAVDAGATRVLLGDAPSGAAAPAPRAGDPFADLIGGSERASRLDLAPTDLGDPFAEEGSAEIEAPAPTTTVVMAAAIEETDPFDASLEPEPEPAVERPRAAAGPQRADLAAGQPSRDELRNLLEKIAWEAFGDVTDRIVRETVQRVEQIAWEVIPKMAETLIREEIRKLKEADEQ